MLREKGPSLDGRDLREAAKDYQFRRPRRDGSTALVLDPLELLERLAALVPAPGRPLLAYNGVLAPHAA